MRLPLLWLKDYVPVPVSAQKLADALTLSGTKVEGIEETSAGAVLDLEITTNRPDCLSLLGLAREVSALTGKAVKLPKLAAAQGLKKISSLSLRVAIEDKKGCPRYTARVIEGVTVGAAPEKVRRFLEAMKTRPISNVVDATNFVLFETGQPLHAFDYDKIAGHTIVVRRARAGEKFLGIDNVEYPLDAQTLVIADAEKPVAIAGVMGGKLTEVTESTKNILLESAFFDPSLVRQASRKYKLSTESSYRFERGVNAQEVACASDRASHLITTWAGGVAARPLIDKNLMGRLSAKPVLFRQSRYERLVGMTLSQSRSVRILKSLGFGVRQKNKNVLAVESPSSRRDVTLEHDVIEEVLRIDGFDKVPAAIPLTHHVLAQSANAKPKTLLELKKYLAALGLDEVVTYSLQSKKMLLDSGFSDLTAAQRVVNAASAEQEYFRPSLLPGMLQALLYNIHRKATSLSFFEIGNRILNGREETVLGVALYGTLGSNWRQKNTADFYELKGLLQNVLSFLKTAPVTWTPGVRSAIFDFSSQIVIENRALGQAGLLSEGTLKRWDIPHEILFAEISLDAWVEARDTRSWRVQPIPKFPSVTRDLAFVVDKEVPAEHLEEAMRQAAPALLREVQLFDEYTGKNIPSGKRSLAFSLSYQKDTGTFTEDEISQLQKQVGDALKSKFGVEFRA